MTESERNHRPRGEDTRAALLAAGTELFGKLGYHAASSRALARAADVNQALIGYHFGGKRGLYVAVFEQIAERMAARFGPARETIGSLVEREDTDREVLIGVLLEMLDRLVDAFTAPESASWAALVVREQQEPSEAFDVLYEQAMFPMLDGMSRLVGCLEGRPADSADVRVLVMTLLGQTLIFRVARASVLRALETDELGPAEVAAAKQRVRRNAVAILSREIGP